MDKAENWWLARDGHTVDCGQGFDAALVATITALANLGCRPAERLMVLHGAGLIAPDGQGLLLFAPGGSGKTTPAAALNVDDLARWIEALPAFALTYPDPADGQDQVAACLRTTAGDGS